MPRFARSRIAAVSAAAFASLVWASAPSNAAVISYFEAIDGDLPATGSPLPIFVLDSGLNTFNGNTGTGAAADFDSFAFTVPAGLQVLQGKLTLIDFSGEPTAASWFLRSGSANSGGGTSLGGWGANSPGFGIMPGAPLLSDTYNVSADTFIGTGISNYTFTFDVHPVPEPASLGVVALGSLALLRRRVRTR